MTTGQDRPIPAVARPACRPRAHRDRPRDTAPIVGRSPRALRHWIEEGKLPARRSGNAWIVDTRDLPLSEAQRARIGQRADRIREVVDRALPTPDGRRPARHGLGHLRAHEVPLEILQSLEQEAADARCSHAIGRAAQACRRAHHRLVVGVGERDPRRRIARLECARAAIRTALAELVCDAPRHPAIARIEADFLPLLGGLLRWSFRQQQRGSDRRRRPPGDRR